MPIEVRAIGGFGEVGKNMIAVKVDDDVVIVDMGLHLPNYITITQDEDVFKLSPDQLIRAQAIPDDSAIADWKDQVKAIIPSHAHLDHIGAIPYLASKYKCPVIASPFTIQVLKTILEDERIKLPNRLVVQNLNSVYNLTKNISIELVEVTHSTPQSAIVVIHTKYGAVVYSNDFKFDNNPVLGRKPNYAALEKIGKDGVALLLCECLYATHEGKTPSEAVAKQMLEDVLLNVNSKGKAVVVTTFSSHIARLKSIIEFAKRMNRKVVLLGRSLAKYTGAATACKIYDFSGIETLKYPRQIQTRLTEINKRREKYLIVATGHQGEPNSVLHKISHGRLKFAFESEDHVVFSCKIIPSEINERNRAELEKDLKSKNVRIFKDIHVSGHASREDLRDFIKLLKPQHLVPSHGEPQMMEAFLSLGKDMGYELNENIHPLRNGEALRLH